MKVNAGDEFASHVERQTARDQPRVARFTDSNGGILALLDQADASIARAHLDDHCSMLLENPRQCGSEDAHADRQRCGHLERSGKVRTAARCSIRLSSPDEQPESEVLL